MLTRRAALRQILNAIGRPAPLSTRQSTHPLQTKVATRTPAQSTWLRTRTHSRRCLHIGRPSLREDVGQSQPQTEGEGHGREELDDILMWTLQSAVSEVTQNASSPWLQHGDTRKVLQGRSGQSGWRLGEASSPSRRGSRSDLDTLDLKAFDMLSETQRQEIFAPSTDQLPVDDQYASPSSLDEVDVESATMNRMREALGDSMYIASDRDGAASTAQTPDVLQSHQAHLAELRASWRAAKSTDEKQILRDRLKWATLNKESAASSAATWRQTFALINEMSPEDTTHYLKRVETITLPAGTKITWRADPLRTAMELYNRTFCVLHLPTPGADTSGAAFFPSSFSQFTLVGTPEETELAKRYIVASGQFAVENTDVTQQSSNSESPTPTAQLDTESWDIARSDESEDPRSSSSSNAPAKWHVSRDHRPIAEILAAAFSDSHLSALELDRLIFSLLRSHSEEDFRDLRSIAASTRNTSANYLIERVLRAILTRPSLVEVTTKKTIRSAFKRLAHLRYFQTIRQITAAHNRLNATFHPSVIPAIDTTAYNYILRSGALSNDVAMFLSVLKDMSKQNLTADARTWNLFYDLTARCRPADLASVKARMDELGTLQSKSALHEFLGLSVPRRLDLRLRTLDAQARQNALPIKDFLADEVEPHADVATWLLADRALSIIDRLLANDMWADAFYVLQQMDPSQIHRSLLRSFVKAAVDKEPANPQRCVDILQRFEAVLARSRKATAMFYSSGVFLDFDSLFRCAYNSRSWNLLRVIWHHACRQGQVTSWMRHKIKIGLRMAARNSAHSSSSSERKIRSAQKIWSINYARFAMDVPMSEVGESMEQLQSAIRKVYRQPFANTLGVDAGRAWQRDLELKDRQVWPLASEHDAASSMDDIDRTSYHVPRRQPAAAAKRAGKPREHAQAGTPLVRRINL